jgi:hypothetical protein
MTRAPRVLFSDTEVAFFLNYADYCIDQTRDYKSTICSELRDLTQTVRSQSGAMKKLLDTLKKYVKKTANVKQFLREGTDYLTIGRLPRNILAIMNAQRKDWGFEVLRPATVPKSRRHVDTSSKTAGASQSTEVSNSVIASFSPVSNKDIV